MRDRQVLALILQLEPLDEQIDQKLVVKDNIRQINLLRHIVSFIVTEELSLHLSRKFLKLTGVLSIKRIYIDDFFLLAFLGFLCGIYSNLFDLLWSYVVESFLDYLVHVEHTDVLLSPVLLHKHVSDSLLAGEGSAEDS